MYMGDDPEAPNYDKDKKLIRSLLTGSRGPMLRKATGLDRDILSAGPMDRRLAGCRIHLGRTVLCHHHDRQQHGATQGHGRNPSQTRSHVRLTVSLLCACVGPPVR